MIEGLASGVREVDEHWDLVEVHIANELLDNMAAAKVAR